MNSDFTPGEAVKICIHSRDPGAQNHTFPGIIENFKKKELLLVADEEAQQQAEVTAQTKYLLYMGSVLNSFARPDGKWEIAVTVHRRLAMI